MSNSVFDQMAIAGKLAVETSTLSRDNKELAKLGIDTATSFLAYLQSLSCPDLSVMGLSMGKIVQIKETSKCCGMDKVVLFPYPIQGQNYLNLIRMYGGDSNTFTKELGINSLVTNADPELLNALEEKYGIIIYERN